MNSIQLVGRITKDIELRFAQGSGTAIARFTVAVNRAFKKDETDFINCISFGKTAETIAQYVAKGQQIAVKGSLQIGSYTNKEGQRVNTADVMVDGFTFIGGGAKSDSKHSQTPTDNDDLPPVDDGDIPF